jgi:hypothetical protein
MKGARTHGVPLSTDAINVLRRLKALNSKTWRDALKSRERVDRGKLPPDCGRVFQYDCKPIDDCNTKAFEDAVVKGWSCPAALALASPHVRFLGRTLRRNASRADAAGRLGKVFDGAQIRPSGAGSSGGGCRNSDEFLAQKPAHWKAAQ